MFLSTAPGQGHSTGRPQPGPLKTRAADSWRSPTCGWWGRSVPLGGEVCPAYPVHTARLLALCIPPAPDHPPAAHALLLWITPPPPPAALHARHSCPGHTYERSSISRWLQRKGTSPKTGEVMEHAELRPNTMVREAIQVCHGKCWLRQSHTSSPSCSGSFPHVLLCVPSSPPPLSSMPVMHGVFIRH